MSGDCCVGAEEEPWNSLAMSALPSAGFAGAEVVNEVVDVVDENTAFEDDEVDDEAERAGSFEDPAVETEARGLPLT